MTIDPSNIIKLLIQKAGFFLDPQLLPLATLMHCDKAQLNVVQKELRIQNFTVSIPQQDGSSTEKVPALRIENILVRWNSYSRPCLEIEVENVDILIEFTNLLLSRNNWYATIVVWYSHVVPLYKISWKTHTNVATLYYLVD